MINKQRWAHMGSTTPVAQGLLCGARRSGITPPNAGLRRAGNCRSVAGWWSSRPAAASDANAPAGQSRRSRATPQRSATRQAGVHPASLRLAGSISSLHVSVLGTTRDAGEAPRRVVMQFRTKNRSRPCLPSAFRRRGSETHEARGRGAGSVRGRSSASGRVDDSRVWLRARPRPGAGAASLRAAGRRSTSPRAAGAVSTGGSGLPGRPLSLAAGRVRERPRRSLVGLACREISGHFGLLGRLLLGAAATVGEDAGTTCGTRYFHLLRTAAASCLPEGRRTARRHLARWATRSCRPPLRPGPPLVHGLVMAIGLRLDARSPGRPRRFRAAGRSLLPPHAPGRTVDPIGASSPRRCASDAARSELRTSDRSWLAAAPTPGAGRQDCIRRRRARRYPVEAGVRPAWPTVRPSRQPTCCSAVTARRCRGGSSLPPTGDTLGSARTYAAAVALRRRSRRTSWTSRRHRALRALQAAAATRQLRWSSASPTLWAAAMLVGLSTRKRFAPWSRGHARRARTQHSVPDPRRSIPRASCLAGAGLWPTMSGQLRRRLPRRRDGPVKGPLLPDRRWPLRRRRRLWCPGPGPPAALPPERARRSPMRLGRRCAGDRTSSASMVNCSSHGFEIPGRGPATYCAMCPGASASAAAVCRVLLQRARAPCRRSLPAASTPPPKRRVTTVARRAAPSGLQLRSRSGVARNVERPAPVGRIGIGRRPPPGRTRGSAAASRQRTAASRPGGPRGSGPDYRPGSSARARHLACRKCAGYRCCSASGHVGERRWRASRRRRAGARRLRGSAPNAAEPAQLAAG